MFGIKRPLKSLLVLTSADRVRDEINKHNISDREGLQKDICEAIRLSISAGYNFSMPLHYQTAEVISLLYMAADGNTTLAVQRDVEDCLDQLMYTADEDITATVRNGTAAQYDMDMFFDKVFEVMTVLMNIASVSSKYAICEELSRRVIAPLHNSTAMAFPNLDYDKFEAYCLEAETHIKFGERMVAFVHRHQGEPLRKYLNSRTSFVAGVGDYLNNEPAVNILWATRPRDATPEANQGISDCKRSLPIYVTDSSFHRSLLNMFMRLVLHNPHIKSVEREDLYKDALLAFEYFSPFLEAYLNVLPHSDWTLAVDEIKVLATHLGTEKVTEVVRYFTGRPRSLQCLSRQCIQHTLRYIPSLDEDTIHRLPLPSALAQYVYSLK